MTTRQRLLILAAMVAVVLFVGVVSATYIVDEKEHVVVTEFGDPVKVVSKPGLYFKTPFIQEVHRLDKRVLPWDGFPENITTQDKKNIHVDVWGRWRIVDPKKFFQAARYEDAGQRILDNLIDAAVRRVVARSFLIEGVRSSNRELLYETEELAAEQRALAEHVQKGREQLEKDVLEAASQDVRANYGIELLSVRFKRINYVVSVRRTVYDRMTSERKRIASLYESEANEQKDRILGKTHREVEEIEGEMKQRVTEIRGRADAQVIKIYAEAVTRAPEFYNFLRQLDAYRNTMAANTELIFSTDNAFFNLLITGDANAPSSSD